MDLIPVPRYVALVDLPVLRSSVTRRAVEPFLISGAFFSVIVASCLLLCLSWPRKKKQKMAATHDKLRLTTSYLPRKHKSLKNHTNHGGNCFDGGLWNTNKAGRVPRFMSDNFQCEPSTMILLL